MKYDKEEPKVVKSKAVKEVKPKVPKEKKPRVSRKDNKLYEKKQITTKTGKVSSVYVKKLATNLPSDIDKPITSPEVEVAQSQADLKASVSEGLSQKELDKMERVKKRIAKKQKA